MVLKILHNRTSLPRFSIFVQGTGTIICNFFPQMTPARALYPQPASILHGLQAFAKVLAELFGQLLRPVGKRFQSAKEKAQNPRLKREFKPAD